jgi:hypothetical protein
MTGTLTASRRSTSRARRRWGRTAGTHPHRCLGGDRGSGPLERRQQGRDGSFPIVKDGLIYVIDLRNGLYILRYTGPRAREVARLSFLEGNSNLGDAARLDKSTTPDDDDDD